MKKAKLKIADGVELPLEFTTSTQAILAKKRVGKTYTASVQAEELLEAEQQVIVIDPTSAWWGLKSTADGTGEGYSIAIFGGEHADVALEPTAGAVLAEAIVENRFSAILDVSLMGTGEANRFVGEFLSTLYRRNREPVHVFCDEADLFGPQQPFGDEARTLGAMQNVVRRGGIKGIGFTMITQRPAVLSKSLLSQVDMLTCLRIHHPADLKQIGEWVKVHASEDDAEEMLASLPSLERGDLWIWNPEIDLFKRVTLRRRRTFDSGATPKVGETVRKPTVAASVDLVALGASIAETVQRAKANDPATLRAEVTRLRRELEELRERPAEDPRYPELRANVERARDALDAAVHASASVREALTAALDGAPPTLGMWPAVPDAAGEESRPAPRRETREPAQPLGELKGPHRKVLGALAWWEAMGVTQPTNMQIAFVAGYSPNSTSYTVPRGQLRSAGMLDYADRGGVALTPEGRRNAKGTGIPANVAGLHAAVLGMLKGPQRKLLEPLLKIYPRTMTNVQLAEATDYSPTSTSYTVPRGQLRTLGLVEYVSGGVRASDLLFPKGRR